MAIGTPVVATPISAIPEIVRSGETGILVPVRRPPAIADAVQRLLEDPGTGGQLAQAASRRLCKRHDAERSAASLSSLFLETVRCA